MSADESRTQDPVASLVNAAARCISLQHFEEAAGHAQAAHALDPLNLGALDALAHALYALGRQADAARYGLLALQQRDHRFGSASVPEWSSPATPPPFDPSRPGRNAIAFSLFGGSSKYCETAILNAIEQPRVYPGWHCRFYVDDSVPVFVIARLREQGAMVLPVAPEQRAWPGTMWRFLACDDEQLDRVLLRDADSLVARREAGAVAEWLESDRFFHHMRDYGSHTELMLAGLWSVARGGVPALAPLMRDFSASATDRRFADQHFLRRHVWPRARRSLLQHDSVFGFLDARPFPDGACPDADHVGAYDSRWSFEMTCNAPDGATAWWIVTERNREICRYAVPVQGGLARIFLPTHFRAGVIDGSLDMRVERDAKLDVQE